MTDKINLLPKESLEKGNYSKKLNMVSYSTVDLPTYNTCFTQLVSQYCFGSLATPLLIELSVNAFLGR